MFFVHLNTKIHHTNSKLQVNMKKIIFIMLLGLVCNTINAQIVTKQELEEYTNIGDMSWSAKAKELSNEYKLNELGELSLSVIKEYKGQSKSQLYRKIIDWVISMSSDAKSAIQVSNEEEGTIIARCYLPNIAKRTMGDNSYRVSIRPLIKFDFKEERIRMTYTLQNYEVLKINDDSANKLLKLLEEPPEKTVFLLVSEAPDMILPTILSRTQRMNVRKIDEASIDRVLQTKYNILPADSISIAHLANGNFIKALETIHLNEENQLFFDLFVSLMRLSYQRKIREMKMWSEQVAGMGRERQKNFLEYCQRMIRENFIFNLHQRNLTYMTINE